MASLSRANPKVSGAELGEQLPGMPDLAIELDPGGTVTISSQECSPLEAKQALMRSLGIRDEQLTEPLLEHILGSGLVSEKPTKKDVDFLVRTIGAVEPRNELETLFAIQMFAVHRATMNLATRLNSGRSQIRVDSDTRNLVKLARTFSMQFETLSRCRRGGGQKMVVEHVHVSDGGRAFVGAL